MPLGRPLTAEASTPASPLTPPQAGTATPAASPGTAHTFGWWTSLTKKCTSTTPMAPTPPSPLTPPQAGTATPAASPGTAHTFWWWTRMTTKCISMAEEHRALPFRVRMVANPCLAVRLHSLQTAALEAQAERGIPAPAARAAVLQAGTPILRGTLVPEEHWALPLRAAQAAILQAEARAAQAAPVTVTARQEERREQAVAGHHTTRRQPRAVAAAAAHTVRKHIPQESLHPALLLT